MRLTITPLILLTAFVSAVPQTTWNVGECAENILVIARGSTEPGNVGIIIGSPLCSGLKKKYGAKFACQGVGTNDGYPAAMGDNSKSKGTCDECINGTVKMFQKLHTKCPKAKFMFMGYSQGGALMTNVIPLLPAEIKSKVIGGVLFGSTRGTIAGYPKENWASFCATDDGACNRRGNSGSSGSHLSYSSNGDVEKAVVFLGKKIDENSGK